METLRFGLLQCAWPWLAAAASGVLLTLCFPPFDQSWLCWVALIPLICAVWFGEEPLPSLEDVTISRETWRRRLRAPALGYLTGFIFFAATFHWLGSLAALFGSRFLLSLPVLLGMVLALYPAVWAWILHAVLVPVPESRAFPTSRRNLAIGALGACAWTALEWTRGWLLYGGFGWNGLGVALHRDLVMIQVCEITGIWGLSWLVAFINLMAVIVLRRLLGEIGGPVFLKRIRWEFSLSVALPVAVFAFGVRTLTRQDVGPTVPLRVAALQPAIPQSEKFAHSEERIFATLDRLTGLAALAQPQLIVWPEASTPQSIFGDETNFRFVADQAARGPFGLLLGTLDFDPVRGEDYNVAALLNPGGREPQVHRKMHLVPFGEFLPMRPVLAPFFGALVPGDFTPGQDSTVLRLNTPSVGIGPLICFEDTLGDSARRFAAAGAQLLVNVTNDGWFADSPAAQQHLFNALFRTVETRRPLLRCGNTGYTGSIDTFGRLALPGAPAFGAPRRIVPFLPPFQEGFVSGEIDVPAPGRSTFYIRHGDWLPQISAWLVGMALAWRSIPMLRRRASRTA